MIQEVNKGEVRGSAVKNSKWVCSLMKNFCRIVGFPIVKHKAQCLALFRLPEQDYGDVVSVGTSKGIFFFLISNKNSLILKKRHLSTQEVYKGEQIKNENYKSQVNPNRKRMVSPHRELVK